VCSKNWQEAETVFLFDLRVDGLLTPKLPGLKKKKQENILCNLKFLKIGKNPEKSTIFFLFSI
jgi:hypothetical protein